MNSSYQYRRLNLATDAIRLIQILHGDTGPIECELFETFLDRVEGLPYEALSYVWGNTESTEKIWVDGCPFTVTENLFEALSDLRQPTEDRLLWIDAICIDQTHDAERGHQVGQMSRIYENAHNVIIWLGASTQEIDCLFKWMHHLNHQMAMVDSQNDKDVWKNQWMLLSWQSEGEPDSGPLQEGLVILLGREWFSRIWVIQEAALAKAAVVTCGRNTVNSQTFVMMPTLLDIRCDESIQSRLEIMPGLLRKTSWWSSGPDSQDLERLLQRFGKSKSKDPRDTIYALLGLSKDAFTSKILRPDYQISLQEAIQRTVAYLLIQRFPGRKEFFLRHENMPRWNMDEFMSALKDLPSAVGPRLSNLKRKRTQKTSPGRIYKTSARSTENIIEILRIFREAWLGKGGEFGTRGLERRVELQIGEKGLISWTSVEGSDHAKLPD